MDDLKKRLRTEICTPPDSMGIYTSWHRNPDGPEAADRIEELEGFLKEAERALADAFPIVACPGAGYSEARLNTVSGDLFAMIGKIRETVQNGERNNG